MTLIDQVALAEFITGLIHNGGAPALQAEIQQAIAIRSWQDPAFASELPRTA